MSVSFLKNLASQKVISPKKASDIEKQAIEESKNIIQVLEAGSSINADKLQKLKASFFGLPAIDFINKKIPKEVLNIVPQDLAENYGLIAFDKNKDELGVALADPGNFKAREAIEFFARENDYKIKFFSTSFKSLSTAIKQYSTLSTEVGKALTLAEEKFKSPKEETAKGSQEDFEEVIKSAPVAKMVSVILNHAIDGRASDIHIEPMEDKTRVRYRIDGQLHTSLVLPKYIHAALISRIKVMAGLKIDETRVPQDGHIRHREAQKKIDLRISTIPISEGEKVVMRILESSKPPTLEDLGFIYHDLIIMRDNIRKPNGMFLVTGPTGSGKSTTLFSTLSILNKEQVNISTLEDPVEYHIEGVNQSQINPDVKFTFASGLRALLRQDPDIIMVGEIRDTETAELAIHAALTGHIVLATLHTNDATGAIPRLIDMKVEPFLLTSTLNIVVAQRLVRRLCPYCRKPAQVPEKIIGAVKEEIGKISKPDVFSDVNLSKLVFFKSEGCSRCGDIGYQGRVSISEVISMTSQMKQVVLDGFKPPDVAGEKERQGMTSLRQDGVIKALKGLVSIEEVFSTTDEEK